MVDTSDSEDDVPLSKRYAAAKPGVNGIQAKLEDVKEKKDTAGTSTTVTTNGEQRDFVVKSNILPVGFKRKDFDSGVQAGAKASGQTKEPSKQPDSSDVKRKAAALDWSDSSDEDDKPLALRRPNVKLVKNRPIKKSHEKPNPVSRPKPDRLITKRKSVERSEAASAKRAKKSTGSGDGKTKWKTLRHCGVLFPPEYIKHGVKMLYKEEPITLEPHQEEVATMYAAMIQTDYAKKDKFNENFWKAFKEILGPGHKIKSLQHCDFRPIWEHLEAEREKKKALSKEEKLQIKTERDEMEAKYKLATVDGRKEAVQFPLTEFAPMFSRVLEGLGGECDYCQMRCQVGNFRVEPPGLFRGRGEHPKMGCLKRRIFPRDIVINIGRNEPVPEHPYSGQKWREVRHDDTVTWLAMWRDPISTKDFKYVWLGANSAFKAESDLAKYEKARLLKGHVADIRKMYENSWSSKDPFQEQMGVALYFIDKLALRAGHEKDDTEEADTVGCCNLKVENVELMDDCKIKFDFLGKDSIRYENEVTVEATVWRLVKKFCSKDAGGRVKSGGAQLFDKISALDLNKELSNLMEGLTVKVFRTYNASITLDQLLHKDSVSETIDAKKADYDRANKEVAILCNHQRSVAKGHADQMQRLADKLQAAEADLDELTLELRVARGEAPAKHLSRPAKALNEDSIMRKIEKKRAQLGRLQVQERSKEDLKTVALGTSKLNYLDPRITVAWCKRQEVPIEKIFNKSLLSKFFWAMDCSPGFRF